MRPRAGARARLGIGPEETCVLVFGGSLGARTINEAAPVAFAGAPYRVLHAAGTRDFEALKARVPPGDLEAVAEPQAPDAGAGVHLQDELRVARIALEQIAQFGDHRRLQA